MTTIPGRSAIDPLPLAFTLTQLGRNAPRSKTGSREAGQQKNPLDRHPVARRIFQIGTSALVPVVIGALLAAIFMVDVVVPLDIAVAAFYSVVIVMAAFAFERRGIVTLAAACIALTLFSRLLEQHGNPQACLINFLISVTAVGATTFLVLKIKSAEASTLEAQAQLAHMGRITTLGELTTSIAHEVNQPLAAVVTNGNACSRWLGAQPPNLVEANAAVDRMVSEANRASQVVQRLRSLARHEAPRQEPLHVNDVVLDVLALARSELQRNRIVISTRLADDLPAVSGDRIQLQQVVLNLVINAIEAMTTVEPGLRELSVSSSQDTSGSICVSVADRGSGLEPSGIDHLFRPFHTTKAGGMGMGLAISRSIVERHGGRIWAAANDDCGSVFQFTLPAA